jgi:cytochrome P450
MTTPPMMLRATHDGRRLTDDEAHQVLQLLLIGGIETTTLLLSNLLHRVIVEPELATQVRARPQLDEVAVEESLRLDSPTLGLFRTPNRTCTVRGVTIRQDSKTMVLFAAVNRDPELWDDPHTFRLDRDPNACDATTASVTGSTSASVPRWPASRDESSCGRSSNGCSACAMSTSPTAWKP